MLYFFLVLLLAGALLAPLLFRVFKRFTGILLALIPLAFFLWACFQFGVIKDGGIIKDTYELIPQLGINLNFSLDALSLIFTLIICFIGALIFIYSVPYFHGSKELAHFLPILIFFSAAMLGLVLADDLILLFICWELTSISSFLLIGFEHEKEEAREAAWQALIITAAGGLGILAGFIILGNISGTFIISEIITSPELSQDPLFIPAMVLILFGAFTKSAQYPFHSWLPAAMTAPTPVSAYLHSAAMVQAGVYLLFRVHPLFHSSSAWTWLLMLFGGVSMVLAGLKAVGQKDLKKILAFATISALGLIIFLIGLGTKKALEAAILFMILHAAYKGGLFMVAGIIDKKVHTRDIRHLSGIFSFMPVVAVGAVLLAASNAGIIPFMGYLGKEVIYKGTIESEGPTLFTLSAFLANTGIVATAFMVGFKPFFGKKPEAHVDLKISPDLYLPPLLLGLFGLFAGIFPVFTSENLLNPVVVSLTGHQMEEHLKLWHGFTTSFILSTITVITGVIAYFFRRYFTKVDEWIVSFKLLDTSYLYDKAIAGLLRYAEIQMRWLQHGYLRWYIFIAVGFVLILGIPAVFKVPVSKAFSFSFSEHYYIYATALFTFVSGIVSIKSKSFLRSIAALGGVGLSIALIFAFLGAPDLAITQFAVETLIVVFYVLVIYRLPELRVFTNKKIRHLDIIISILAGLFVTLVLLFVNYSAAEVTDSQFYLEKTYLETHSRNIVNVILTDFRAMDTLAETLVLATAGFGVYTLLRLRITKKDQL
jgi:multicomponent Na+:H+ antiporter subunit A